MVTREFRQTLDKQMSDIFRASRAAFYRDRNSAISEIMTQIGAALDCAIGTLRVLDRRFSGGPTLVLEWYYGCDDAWKERTRYLNLDADSIMVDAFTQQTVLACADILDPSARLHYTEFAHALNMRATICVPVGEYLGVAAFYRHTTTEFTSSQKRFCKAMADFLADMILRFDHQDRVEVLRDLSKTLSKHRDVRQLSQDLVELVNERFNVETTGLFLATHDHMGELCLLRTAVAGVPDDWFPDELYRPGEWMTGKAFQWGKTMFSDAMDDHPDSMPASNRKYSERLSSGVVQHQISIPLHGSQGVLGVLRVMNKLDRSGKLSTSGFTVEDVNFLETVGCIAATSIEHAQLIERAQRLTGTLSALQQTAKANADFVGKAVDEVICSVASIAKGLGYADYVTVITLNEDTKVMETRYQDLSSALAQEYMWVGGTTQSVIASGKRQVFTNVSISNSDIGIASDSQEEDIRAYVVMPLIARNRRLGAMLLYSKRAGTYSDAFELELIETCASHIAVALDNYRVYSRAQAVLTRRAADNERQRLEDDLHHLLNVFTLNIIYELERVQELLDSQRHDEAREFLDGVCKASWYAYDELRNVFRSLSDSRLMRNGLADALLHSMEHIKGYDRINHIVTLDERLNPVIELAVYRIAQGALTNALKHAGLDELKDGRVWVVLRMVEESDERNGCGKRLVLVVRDNGRGFDTTTLGYSVRSFGVPRMRELARKIHAEFKITSHAGAFGTEISLSVPIRNHDEVANEND